MLLTPGFGLHAGLPGITVIPMKTISFKVTDEEARTIRRRARSLHISVSEYLRRRASGIEESGVVGKVRCAVTGAEIFAPLENVPPLTSEQVREMLSDFP